MRSEADKLSDWQALGRKQPFVYRSLIAGPPPLAHKKPKAISLLFQDGEFDKVVDLVEKGAADAASFSRISLRTAAGAKP